VCCSRSCSGATCDIKDQQQEWRSCSAVIKISEALPARIFRPRGIVREYLWDERVETRSKRAAELRFIGRGAMALQGKGLSSAGYCRREMLGNLGWLVESGDA
jgi:hypothetical protein